MSTLRKVEATSRHGAAIMRAAGDLAHVETMDLGSGGWEMFVKDPGIDHETQGQDVASAVLDSVAADWRDQVQLS